MSSIGRSFSRLAIRTWRGFLLFWSDGMRAMLSVAATFTRCWRALRSRRRARWSLAASSLGMALLCWWFMPSAQQLGYVREISGGFHGYLIAPATILWLVVLTVALLHDGD